MPVAPDLCGIALDGRYELLEPIGEGAFGRVYRGRDRRLQRTVAIKVIKPWWAEDPAWVAAFERETRLLARISDPGIVAIFDVGHAPEGLYCVSELVEGESLAQRLQRLQRGPLTVPEATAIATRLCDALAGAHALSIVHRDVKPANVLLGSDGAVKLADFGVAKLAEGSTAGTIGVGIVGTPRYMAPEQGRGEPVSPATDVYSVGIVLYEMLAGDTPFGAGPAVELAVRHLQEPPAPLPDAVAPPLRAVVTRALAKDPSARWADGAALAAALRETARGRMPRGADETLPRAGHGPRTDHHPSARRRSIAAVGGVALLVAALAVAALLTRGGSAAARVQVPGLVGGSVASARARLHTLHLRAHVDEVPAPGVQAGTVTRQRPLAGHSTGARSTVRLSVAEVPRWRSVETVTTADSAPIHIIGQQWRIAVSASGTEHCTLLVFCSHSTVQVLRVGAGGATAQVASLPLTDATDQTHRFQTGPGTYEIKVDPASGDTHWAIAVDDDY